MDLFLIRHGESYNNALKDLSQRLADPPLTARGEEQSRRVSEYVGGSSHLDPPERDGRLPVDHLYCSPMRRALQTARPMAERLGIDPEVWLEVHEVGGIWLAAGGRLGGLSRQEMEGEFPRVDPPPSIGTDGWWPGGQETYHAGRGRAIGVALALKERARAAAESGQPRERVAIVTHGDFMSALIKALVDQLPGRGVYYVHHNTAITRFQLDRDGCVCHYLNRCEHLEDPGLAGR